MAACLLLDNGVLLEHQMWIPLETAVSSMHVTHAIGRPGTALHWTVARNNEAIVKTLVKLSANPTAPQMFRTPQHKRVAVCDTIDKLKAGMLQERDGSPEDRKRVKTWMEVLRKREKSCMKNVQI